jgi:diguanylate cyclase (GGDEF)-like protein
VSLEVPRSFGLTAFGDLTQCILLACCTLSVLPNIGIAHKKAKFFWLLLSIGFGMWFCAQVLWTYFEVLARQEVPNPFVGDVILFLHIVPIMAAVAVRPHIQQDELSVRGGPLDFFLLLTWWLYLYLFIVIPWQYVYFIEAAYGRSFDVLYAVEQMVLILALALVWRKSADPWRGIYAQFLGAALVYGIGSALASAAIDAHVYYTGSLYDVPLVAAMAWFAGVGLMPRTASPMEPGENATLKGHGIWTARLAMLAVFSTPLTVAWAVFGGHAPQRVRTYRLVLTVAVMIVLGALVFLKQHRLDRKLLSLLDLSRQNLDEMCSLKNELENKEQSLRWHSLELQRKNLELQEISFTDVLTGVWNRRYLEEILAAEAGQVLRNYQGKRSHEVRGADHRDLVFIMVDMDFFKQVNDLYGHPAGDRLLQRVAERLSTVVRKSDVLVRWGGEEFLIMTRCSDPLGIPAFCSRILDVMASQPFDLGHGIRVRKTCSIGWTPYPWSRDAFEAICAEEVIELTDWALYRAKAWGRNQAVGVLPAEGAALTEAFDLRVLQNERSGLIRIVKTDCPQHNYNPSGAAHTSEPVEEPTR